jgi:hypothetical protein
MIACSKEGAELYDVGALNTTNSIPGSRTGSVSRLLLSTLMNAKTKTMTNSNNSTADY